MDLNFQQIFCGIIILMSIYFSIKSVIYAYDLDEVISPILSGCSTIITFFIMLGYYEKVDLLVTDMLRSIFKNSIKDNGLFHIFALVLIFLIIKGLIHLLLKILHSFSLNYAINKLNRNKIFLVIFSAIFGVIRGMVIIILLCIPLVLYNSLVGNSQRISFFDGLEPYDKFEQMVDSKRVNNISSGLIENISSNKTIYYNGVTIDEGIRSNESIKNKAVDLTKRYSTDRKKSESIYRWVGSNIKYDDEKAIEVMRENSGHESGAIPTFKTKAGICFDYACLFTAMCKDVGIKTRIIIGEAYTGEEYVSHAWNQVYLSDEGKWINVDPTFYVAGDYFDNSNFENDHKAKSIAGEF